MQSRRPTEKDEQRPHVPYSHMDERDEDLFYETLAELLTLLPFKRGIVTDGKTVQPKAHAQRTGAHRPTGAVGSPAGGPRGAPWTRPAQPAPCVGGKNGASCGRKRTHARAARLREVPHERRQ